jgi:hydrogenase maturation protease
VNAFPAGSRGQVVIIGYGNPLRGDDATGWHAATTLASDPRLAGADVLTRHQLTPELAKDIAHARLAVLIDASNDGDTPPGTVSIRRVTSSHPPAPTWSHHLHPTALASLAKTLYGSCPPVFLITVTGALFGYGDQLSPAVRRALPEIAATIDLLQATTQADQLPYTDDWPCIRLAR